MYFGGGSHQGLGGATKTYNYDAIGNITAKSDFADNYLYGENGAGRHAVTSVQKGGTTFASYKYDANGNMTTGAGRDVAYTSFNMPRAITQSGQYSTFHYSPDRARMVQTSAHGMSVYLDLSGTGSKYYEREYKGGAISHGHYIFAGGSTVAVYTKKSNSASATTRYFHKDHLGSIDAISSEAGTVVERLSYDPFGQRRQLNGQDGTIIAQTSHHGYTGHEHLDELGLVHMNGRLYDPALGRFMSADPHIADAVSTQGFNRYSYVDNNPLSATDPTGYFKPKKAVGIYCGRLIC